MSTFLVGSRHSFWGFDWMRGNSKTSSLRWCKFPDKIIVRWDESHSRIVHKRFADYRMHGNEHGIPCASVSRPRTCCASHTCSPPAVQSECTWNAIEKRETPKKKTLPIRCTHSVEWWLLNAISSDVRIRSRVIATTTPTRSCDILSLWPCKQAQAYGEWVLFSHARNDRNCSDDLLPSSVRSLGIAFSTFRLHSDDRSVGSITHSSKTCINFVEFCANQSDEYSKWCNDKTGSSVRFPFSFKRKPSKIC